MLFGRRRASITPDVIDAVTRDAEDAAAACRGASLEPLVSLVASPSFLRRVLQADALSCIACGALQLAFPEALASLLGLPDALLIGTGAFLLAYAAVVGWVALREPPRRGVVWAIVAGNAGWALACVGLLLSGRVVSSALGMAYVLMQAVTVLVLAELQWTGLRRSAPRLAS